MGSNWLSDDRSAIERYHELLREAEASRGRRPPATETPHWQDHRREEQPWLYEVALPPGSLLPLGDGLGDDRVRRALTLAARQTCRGIRCLTRRLLRGHRGMRSFESEVRGAGGIVGCLDAGYRAVPLEKVVGSVGRAANLRSDFFYRKRPAITERYLRIGEALRQGRALPALELYGVRLRRGGANDRSTTEYYVLDGHHRVAMARKLGQSFLDAHVVEYKVADDGALRSPASPSGTR